MQHQGLTAALKRLSQGGLDAEQLVEWTRTQEPSPQLADAMTEVAVTHTMPAARLAAAWSLDLLGVTRPGRLINAFETEQDGNVRANIVWALARQAPTAISADLYRAFLADDCVHVQIVALRYLARLFVGEEEFLTVWANAATDLIRKALLEHLDDFKLGPDVAKVLIAQLEAEPVGGLAPAVVTALAALGKTEVLIHHFNHGYAEQDETMALAFARAFVNLCETRPRDQLRKLYESGSKAVRMAVIEALGAAGGPHCQMTLQEIVINDPDPMLRDWARAAVKGMPPETAGVVQL